jgi:5-methylcytosine-specific restriction enzyme subunit McrC
MPYLQVFEHERLTIHPDEFGRFLSADQFEKLCQFNDHNQNKYFTIIRNGIKFSQYVGVIQLGRLTIEILPKTDKLPYTKEGYKQETKKWQNVLLRMLSLSGELELETVSEASLKKRTSLLDLYFEIYLNELDALLRKGLTKKYRHQTDNVKTWKGRMNFAKNIQHNLIHRERFFTTHQQYDHNHLINQILHKALIILDQLALNNYLSDRIKKLLFYYPEMKPKIITQDSFKQIRLTRKTKDHDKALRIARMLILNYSPDISKGNENMLALLFDMNILWEKYIYRMLKAHEDKTFTVDYQASDRFWENRTIKPDIVIQRKTADKQAQATETIVIDTKWKRLNNNRPSDDDLKQMYAYNMYWNSAKSMLLYPAYDNTADSDFGKYHKGRSTDNLCKIGFVSVLDKDGKLSSSIASDVLKKFES